MLEEVDIAQATEITVVDQQPRKTVADGEAIIGADEVENGTLTIFVDSEIE
jgi:hypothetical protein